MDPVDAEADTTIRMPKKLRVGTLVGRWLTVGPGVSAEGRSVIVGEGLGIDVVGAGDGIGDGSIVGIGTGNGDGQGVGKLDGIADGDGPAIRTSE